MHSTITKKTFYVPLHYGNLRALRKIKSTEVFSIFHSSIFLDFLFVKNNFLCSHTFDVKLFTNNKKNSTYKHKTTATTTKLVTESN